MLMDVITSPRGSARCGKEWSCRAESIFALKGINLEILHSEAVHCYMGYILPITFFMYGLSLYIKSKTLQPSSSSYSSWSSSTSHKAQSLRCCIQLWLCTSAYKRTVWDAHNMRRKNLHSHEIITRGRKYVLAKTTRTFKWLMHDSNATQNPEIPLSQNVACRAVSPTHGQVK